MPVPGSITALSETPSSNSPAGSETVGTQANDYFQAAFAFIRQIYDGQLLPLAAVNMNSQRINNVLAGAVNTDAANVGQVIGTLGGPSGTRLVFQQATAPTFWVVDASAFLQDAAVRFNAGAGNAGTANWTSWNFGATFSTDGHVLSVAEMASHQHTDFGHAHGLNDPGHGHGLNDPGHSHVIGGQNVTGGGAITMNGASGTVFTSTQTSTTGMSVNGSGTGISMAAAAANISFEGGNNAHAHTFRGPQVKFADVVVCIKS